MPPTKAKVTITATAMPAAAPALRRPVLFDVGVMLTLPELTELVADGARGVTVTVFVWPPVVTVVTCGVKSVVGDVWSSVVGDALSSVVFDVFC